MLIPAALVAIVLAAPLDSSPGSELGQAQAAATPAQGRPLPLRKRVHQALRDEALASGAKKPAAIRALVEIYRELSVPTSLADEERQQLQAGVRNRLKRAGQSLERQAAKSKPVAAQTIELLADEQGLFAQRRAAPVAGAPAIAGPAMGGPTNQPGQELIDLIQSTIAPKSWDINGGLGTIRYFEPSQVLVIRQTDTIHERVGDALGQLRD